ncbi:hypothetical protein [Ochrobactrum sp. 3-3]|uniref:hypothetical protein n=1 Tax=Ochrobactrum sp. 3-3 TaxID=1830124 RepID=UPI000DF01090|nr:hypothetical protein [Ochrobactrum sp. 3-3]
MLEKLVQALVFFRKVCLHIKNHGVRKTGQEALLRLQRKSTAPNTPKSSDEELREFLRAAERLLVINAGFKFDDKINQRSIALASEAAKSGISVLFIAWEWWPGELLDEETRLVKDNIFQIAPRHFSAALSAASDIGMSDKLFILTVPTREMALKITEAQARGFRVIYDIFDDWESFNCVGQAPWYKKEIEHHAILNANKVTVVSPGLKKLFEPLRSNIAIVPNGYSPRNSVEDHERVPTTIGYFGHLADGWFDWDLVFGLARQMPQLNIEIIGGGHSQEWEVEAQKYPNVKLLGIKPYEDLPLLTRSWSVGLIPFRKSRLSECVDPLKVYEYLELGLLSISTGMPHLGQYPNCFHVESLDQLTALIERHVQGSLSASTPHELSAFLAQAQWSQRLKAVLA